MKRQKPKRLPDDAIVGTHNGNPITAKEWREMMEQEERDMEASIEYGDREGSPSDADPGL